MNGITYATWNLHREWLSSICSWYNWNYSQNCLFDAIDNFWVKYLRNRMKNMAYYVYDKAFTIEVQDWAIAVIFIMLFLSFIVGFIFFAKRK